MNLFFLCGLFTFAVGAAAPWPLAIPAGVLCMPASLACTILGALLPGCLAPA